MNTVTFGLIYWVSISITGGLALCLAVTLWRETRRSGNIEDQLDVAKVALSAIYANETPVHDEDLNEMVLVSLSEDEMQTIAANALDRIRRIDARLSE